MSIDDEIKKIISPDKIQEYVNLIDHANMVDRSGELTFNIRKILTLKTIPLGHFKITNGDKEMKSIVYNTDCMEYMKTVQDKFYNFIFIDPPYFRIKGEFDFKMEFQEWIDLHKILASECNRILKDNGSIILWGHAKRIAYQQIEFDKYFNLLNSSVWRKKNGQNYRLSKETQRTFIPLTERFLFYDKGENKAGLQMIYSNPDLFGSIKKYMREERDKIIKTKGFKTTKEFNGYINKITDTVDIMGKHYCSDFEYSFPTKKVYIKLQTTGFFQRPYERLRQEYERLRRPFNLTEKIKFDVIDWNQEDNLTRENNHPTCKPPGLVAELIKICCSKNSKIFEPFQGTETLRKIAWNMGLYYEGCELYKKYYEAQENRFKNYIAQPEIFNKLETRDLIFQKELF